MKKPFTFRELAGSVTLVTAVLLATLLLSSFAAAQVPTYRIMPLGNSITRGTIGSPDEVGYRRALYLSLTATDRSIEFVGSLSDGLIGDFDLDHEGHDGWHAEQVAAHITDWLTNTPADVILLHIGTNDITNNDQDIAEIAQILDSVDVMETALGHPIVVIVAQLMLRGDSKIVATKAFNTQIDSLVTARIGAGDNLVLVDMEHALIYPTDLHDMIHPTQAGYDKMAAVWFGALDSLLPPPPLPPTIDDVTLSASTPQHTTIDDLFCTYETGGGATTVAVAWFVDGLPLMSVYLPFEGGDSISLRDWSGNGHIAQRGAGVTWLQSGGRAGHGAYEFDGSFGAYLELPPALPASGYTKAAWIRLAGPGDNGILCGDSGHTFWIPENRGTPGRYLAAGHGSVGEITVEDTAALDLNTWYHVAVTYDPASDGGAMVLYRNGGEVARATNVSPAPAGERLWLGGYQGVGTFTGRLDEVRLYNRALGPDQVRYLFQEQPERIDQAETAVAEEWHASVRAFSQYDSTAARSSDTLFILDPPPVGITGLELAATGPNNGTMDTLQATYTMLGAATASAASWFLNGHFITTLLLPCEGGLMHATRDYSGQEQPITVQGNVGWIAGSGHDGTGGLSFDGESYLEAGEIMPAMSSYTKTAWVRRTADDVSGSSIIGGDAVTGGHQLWAPQSNGYRLAAGHDGDWFLVVDPEPLLQDTLYFVAVTFDAVSSDLILYRNGYEVDRASANGMSVTDSTVQIGALAGGDRWHGMLDEVQVFNRPLSPAQIASLYEAGWDQLVSDETAVGDEWRVYLTPFSDQAAGLSQFSNKIVITTGLDVAVENLVLQASSPDVLVIDDLVSSFDLTPDAVTSTLAWYRNGQPLMELLLPFEGGGDTTFVDWSGEARVTSVGSGVSWSSTAGHDGYGAILFDGSPAASLMPGEALPVAEYTIMAWVRRIGGGPNQIVSGVSSHALWAPEANGYHLAAGINGDRYVVEDSVPLPLDEWHHVAVSYNASLLGGTMILYRDGQEVDRALGVGAMVPADPSVWIGAADGTGGFSGWMDDVRIYNRFLCSDYVQQIAGGVDSIIPFSCTETNEQWQVAVTPFASTEAGATEYSNTLMIQTNVRLADLLAFSLSGADVTTDTLQVSYSLEGDATTAATAWQVNNQPVAELYLPMEGSIGPSKTALHDFSGHGHQVAAIGDPDWLSTGGYDGHGVFRFDGSQHLDAGNIFPTDSGYTITAWVFRSGEAAEDGSILAGDDSSGGHVLWAPAGENHRLSAGHNGNWTAVQDSVPMALNTWSFVALTFDSNSGLLRLYRNGQPVDQATLTGADLAVTDVTVEIAAWNASHRWIGRIDDLRLYPRAFSSEQLALMYTSGRDMIAPQETEAGDRWQAATTPFSIDDAGQTTQSNVLQIGDIPHGEVAFNSAENITGCGLIDTLWIGFMPNPGIAFDRLYCRVGYDATVIEPLDAVLAPHLVPVANYAVTIDELADVVALEFTSMAEPLTDTLPVLGLVVQGVAAASLVYLTFDSTLVEQGSGLSLTHTVGPAATVVVDCAAPAAPELIDPPGGLCGAEAELAISLHDETGLDEAMYCIDSCGPGWTPLWSSGCDAADTVATIALPALTEGFHDLYFQVTDDAGNVRGDSCEAVQSFYVDLTPPTIEVLSPLPDTTTYDTLPVLTIRMQDDKGLHRGMYKLNDAACTEPWIPMWASNAGTVDTIFQFQVPSPGNRGTHALQLSAQDDAGNVGYDPCGWFWIFTYSDEGCCSGVTGNVNDDPNDEVTLTDLTTLVNDLFLFIRDSSAYCRAEANTNGDSLCETTLTDLTLLVNHLFVTFESLASCADFDPGDCDEEGVAAGRMGRSGASQNTAAETRR